MINDTGFNNFRNKASRIISIPDTQLRNLSYAETADKYAKKNEKQAKINTALIAAGIPIANGVATAATLTKYPLLTSSGKLIKKFDGTPVMESFTKSQKAIIGTQTALSSAAGIGGFMLTSKAYDKASEKIPFMQNFKEKFPLLNDIANLAASFGGAFALRKGAQKVTTSSAFIKGMKNGLNGIEKTSVGKKFISSVSKFASKHPQIINTVKKASVFAAPAIIIGAIASAIHSISKQNKEAEQTYQEAKEIKSQVAVNYAKHLEQENSLNQVALSIMEAMNSGQENVPSIEEFYKGAEAEEMPIADIKETSDEIAEEADIEDDNSVNEEIVSLPETEEVSDENDEQESN